MSFKEYEGKLEQSTKNKSKWRVAGVIFSVSAVQNSWVVRNMKTFKNKNLTVIVRLSDHKTLLSVRTK